VLSGTGVNGLILPALTLAIPLAGFMAQSTRTEFERALDQPFIVSARMRGMGEWGIRLRHVLRHAVIPAVTLSGWALGATLSGAVIVESIFNRPGIGSVLVSAVSSQDLPVVVGIVTLVAIVYVVANLLVDIVYTIVDPRLELK
jgi:peptide/nickel transport system permease protein